MESSHRAVLVLRRSLDYDAGDRDFMLTLMASVIEMSLWVLVAIPILL
jgi:hypothetical protein